MIIKAIREGLGRLIVLGDYLSRPKAIERSAEDQARIDESVSRMSIYQFYACPFCIKTRRFIRKLSLPMVYRNAQAPGQFRDDLEELGGRIKVPCLRIEEDGEDRWLYESDDIIVYLEQRFGAVA
jgi:glutaredoxin